MFILASLRIRSWSLMNLMRDQGQRRARRVAGQTRRLEACPATLRVLCLLETQSSRESLIAARALPSTVKQSKRSMINANAEDPLRCGASVLCVQV